MSFPKGLRASLVLAALSLAFSGDLTPLAAQTTSASVSGTVQDAQGGVRGDIRAGEGLGRHRRAPKGEQRNGQALAD